MLIKSEAQNRATELALLCEKQIGGSWEPHIFQNLGWHYQAQCGKMVMREGFVRKRTSANRQRTYDLWVGLGGQPPHYSPNIGDRPVCFSPLEAYKAKLKWLRGQRDTIEADINELLEIGGEPRCAACVVEDMPVVGLGDFSDLCEDYINLGASWGNPTFLNH